MKKKSITADPASHRLPLLRGLLPIVVSICILSMLWDQVTQFDAAAVSSAVFQFTAMQWITATGLTVISFYAIAQYDRLAATELHMVLPKAALLHAGWRATAISQVLGYGLITGSLVRWRALGKSYGSHLWACSQLTAAVTACFFAGWAGVTSLAFLVAQPAHAPAALNYVACFGVIAVATLALLSFAPRAIIRVPLPAPRLIFPTLSFTALDTLAACAIIYIFLPEGYTPFFVLFSAFLISLAAGMISGLPGGVGAFELCLVGMIGGADPAPLLTAILGFRMIYYAAPALLAGLTLLKVSKAEPRQCRPKTMPTLSPELAAAAPPEAQLVALGQLHLRTTPEQSAAALWHRAQNTDILLGDPFGSEAGPNFMDSLLRDAQAAGRGVCIYKSTDGTQRQGWMSVKVGSEAIVKPSDFTMDGPQFRQLRRKLRKAKKAGVRMSGAAISADQIQRLDAAWQRRNGPARGFSMGYVDHRLLASQTLFAAHKDGAAIAFLTVLKAQDKWTLDIIRSDPDCPDGTLHALVCHAIEVARKKQISLFSLAAAPGYLPDSSTRVDRLITRVLGQHAHAKGLAQFKACFAPHWQPTYISASSLFALLTGMLDIWALINWPDKSSSAPTKPAHNDYGFYEIASSSKTCHARQRMTYKEKRNEHAKRSKAKRTGQTT